MFRPTTTTKTNARFARLRRVALAALAAAGSAALLPSLPAEAGTGSGMGVSIVNAVGPANSNVGLRVCTIKTVDVTPTGAGASFSVATSVNTQIAILATPASQVPGGSFGVDQTWTTSHSTGLLAMLEPGTNYDYAVTAKSADGASCTKTGTFATLHRRLRVTFESVIVWDDSDALSDGDFYINLKVGNQWFLPFQNSLPGNPILIGSNGAFSMGNFKKDIVDGPLTFDIGAELYDVDNSCNNMCLSPGSPPPFNSPSGSNSDADWATIVSGFSAPAGGQAAQGEFVLTTSNSHKVKFSMTGHYAVDYI